MPHLLLSGRSDGKASAGNQGRALRSAERRACRLQAKQLDRPGALCQYTSNIWARRSSHAFARGEQSEAGVRAWGPMNEQLSALQQITSVLRHVQREHC